MIRSLIRNGPDLLIATCHSLVITDTQLEGSKAEGESLLPLHVCELLESAGISVQYVIQQLYLGESIEDILEDHGVDADQWNYIRRNSIGS